MGADTGPRQRGHEIGSGSSGGKGAMSKSSNFHNYHSYSSELTRLILEENTILGMHFSYPRSSDDPPVSLIRQTMTHSQHFTASKRPHYEYASDFIHVVYNFDTIPPLLLNLSGVSNILSVREEKSKQSPDRGCEITSPWRMTGRRKPKSEGHYTGYFHLAFFREHAEDQKKPWPGTF